MIRPPLWECVLMELEDFCNRDPATGEVDEDGAIAFGVGFEQAMAFLWSNPEAAMEAARQYHIYDLAEPTADPDRQQFYERMASAAVDDRENWDTGKTPQIEPR